MEVSVNPYRTKNNKSAVSNHSFYAGAFCKSIVIL